MTDLATRIADVKKKAEKAIEAASSRAKNPNRSDWLEQRNYRQASPASLFIEMADEIDRLTAQLEKARKALEPIVAEHARYGHAIIGSIPIDTIHLRTAARVHAELAEKEKE